MNYSLGNTLVNGGALNPDGLSLDLQFAADKTLTARKGPTPTFTRASVGSYHGLNINVVAPAGSFEMSSSPVIIAGKPVWTAISDSAVSFVYDSGRWQFAYLDGDDYVYVYAALGNEFRPDQANWTGASGISVSTSSNFSIQYAATNEPRFDHSTTAPNACLGLLIEESRTNLVFPSATLTTQTRTVTAVSHTLSFYGTGTVVLSGVAVATVTGTGAYPTRTTLTFTPTAGSLIMTVTGSVTEAQLEAGAFPTSYIPTVAASVVRSADLCTISGAGFTTIYNEPEHSLFVEATGMSHVGFPSYLSFDNSLSAEQSALAGYPLSNRVICTEVDGGTTVASVQLALTLNQNNKMAGAMKLNSFQVSLNGTLGTEDTSGTMATATSFKIGRSWGSVVLSGTYKQVKVFKKRLSNAKLQTLTT
jgi:hypothetical protein